MYRSDLRCTDNTMPRPPVTDEKDRAHLTRTSDTSCMIEGDSDDEHKTLMTTVPRDCWNCREYHWTAT